MLLQRLSITPQARYFGHPEAVEVFQDALDHREAHTIVLDMSCAVDATTSAFARLVLLRRELKRSGRELRITGMQQSVQRLLEVHRLIEALPRL